MNKLNEKKEFNIADKNNLEFKKPKKNKFLLSLIIIFIFIIFLAIKTGFSIYSWQTIAQDMISNTPSIILDIDNNEIAKIGNTKISKNIKISQIPDNLKNAYISIEDQRFYKHHGVDFPRTTAAVFNYLKNLGSSSFGGSSITQQLVKNLTGDNSSKVTRKVSEWFKALAIENILSKEEILEAYFNIIYVGPNIYGVEMGSHYYFSKSVSDLTLEECAFLAGINNSPNSYNPFNNKNNDEKIKTRTKTVIKKMFELGYISEDDFNKANSNIDKGLNFKNEKLEAKEKNSNYSYHTDALINEIILDISNSKNISQKFAQNYLEMAGLNIYSSQNSKIQKTIENEVEKQKYKLISQNNSSVTAQAAMVVINHNTGEVVGCVGGIGEKTARGFNRAVQAFRQTGSAGKPISVLAPAISKKIITPSTIYVDEITTFDDGTEEGYSPTDYNDYKGEITVRQAVESSQNIPFVKIMEELTPKESIKYMKKLGITSLTKKDNNLNLALGGLDKGISPLELATAYAAIANDGIYIEPTFYSRIENSSGKIVCKPTQKKKKVMSKQVAFILKSLLQEPVVGNSGTAVYCKIKGIDVAAKTGTTNEEYDRWLCGFTPYYTGVTWFGFDMNETIKFNRKNPSGQIWSSVMSSIHENLPNKKFDIPEGIESAKICPTTGLLATEKCKNSYEEYFLNGTTPTSYCSKHKTNQSNIPNTNTRQINNTPTDDSNVFEQ